MAQALEYSVQEAYEKNPEIKPEDIQDIRDWLCTQPQLPHDFITDLELILAYHSCGCDIEETKKVIDINYTLRTLFTFYQNRKLDKGLEVAFHTWLMTPLPPSNDGGCRAVYCQMLDADPEHFVYGDVIKAFMMVMDLWQYEEGVMPAVAIIVNMDKVSLSHISRIDLSIAQQVLYFLQEAMFIRLKEFHFINAPSFIDKVLAMFKPFTMKEKVDVLKTHQVGSSTLYQYISKTILPKEAGGEYKDVQTLRDEIWNKIKANEKVFEEESKKRVDEVKRPGKPKTMSSFFSSMEENFKKLEID